MSKPVPISKIAAEPGTVKQEKLLHHRFSDHLWRGEWFRPNLRRSEGTTSSATRAIPKALPRDLFWPSPDRVTLSDQ